VLTYALFLVGFFLLVKGGDVLVEGSVSLARRRGISDMVVGLTIVSFGTSAPELVVNVVSSFGGSSEIAIGNVIGSNIANILLIIGITAIICDLPLKRDTLLSEIPFSLSAAVLVGFLANASLFEGKRSLLISRGDGMVMLFFFVLFMAYVFRIARESDDEPTEPEVSTADGGDDDGDAMKRPPLPTSKAVACIVGGVVALFLGGKFVVDGAIALARLVGMSETFIGLTVVAVGTSLPELVTSIVAASKQNVDIAVGNAIGSNIFNILWILGISAVIEPLPFDVVTNHDILVLIFASSLLILALATGKRNAIDRHDGFVFVLLYVVYTIFCIKRG